MTRYMIRAVFRDGRVTHDISSPALLGEFYWLILRSRNETLAAIRVLRDEQSGRGTELDVQYVLAEVRYGQERT